MIHAVIPAAGQGKRLGGKIKKQFLTLCDLPVAVHTLTAFQDASL
ncbi:MAG: 2-C-methyl-D-erythritol 4-phosphate cytidylyltransferase [Candidatus Manganitrophus sp.]|nr:2-C-methyl-D-erythritol 4-phosphate cytidylyltransferase [Candidatus Manganitrophus sp.]